MAMTPAPYRKSFQTALLIMTCYVMSTAASPEPHIQAKDKIAHIAKIIYYTDSRGMFTMQSPPAVIDHYLPLKGFCRYPEFVIQVTKMGSGNPARQATFRLNGRSDFSTRYLLKEGSGNYEVVIFGKKITSSNKLAGLCTFSVRSNRDLPRDMPGPSLNDMVLTYVKGVIGKNIGSGECWDLAQEALDATGADWSRPLNYGMLIDPSKDPIAPGDIIQFKSVRLRSKLPNGGMMYRTLGAPDHTAIIMRVEGVKKYTVAHQNSDGKRYVITSEVDLDCMITGRYWIYRPVAGFIR
jgi:hypothetical protein